MLFTTNALSRRLCMQAAASCGSSDHTPIIAGVVGGVVGLAILALVMAAVIWCRRRNRNAQNSAVSKTAVQPHDYGNDKRADLDLEGEPAPHPVPMKQQSHAESGVHSNLLPTAFILNPMCHCESLPWSTAG